MQDTYEAFCISVAEMDAECDENVPDEWDFYGYHSEKPVEGVPGALTGDEEYDKDIYDLDSEENEDSDEHEFGCMTVGDTCATAVINDLRKRCPEINNWDPTTLLRMQRKWASIISGELIR